jgi:RNA polymerase-interacting CarD/CdnL/TRCF family regulator
LVKLAVGDLVVYGRHGAGRVTSRQKKGRGKPHEIIVLDLAAGLSVTLPLERALEYLRPLASKTEVACVQTTLREDKALTEDTWLKRWKIMQAKVATGEAVSLAEVVRDSAQRERTPAAHGKTKRLSPSEHQLYLEARQLLASELGFVRGVEPSEADEWITDQLSRIAA